MQQSITLDSNIAAAKRAASTMSMPRVNRGPRHDPFHTIGVRNIQSDELDPGEEDVFAGADLTLTQNIAVYVNDAYPGHPWYIEVSHFKGIVKINLPLLMGQWYATVRIRDLHTDPGFKSILRRCGEILERFQMPRVGYSHAHFNDALDRMPVSDPRHSSYRVPE